MKPKQNKQYDDWNSGGVIVWLVVAVVCSGLLTLAVIGATL